MAEKIRVEQAPATTGIESENNTATNIKAAKAEAGEKMLKLFEQNKISRSQGTPAEEQSLTKEQIQTLIHSHGNGSAIMGEDPLSDLAIKQSHQPMTAEQVAHMRDVMGNGSEVFGEQPSEERKVIPIQPLDKGEMSRIAHNLKDGSGVLNETPLGSETIQGRKSA